MKNLTCVLHLCARRPSFTLIGCSVLKKSHVAPPTTSHDCQFPSALPRILSRCFYPVFFHIQMLWELVLLGEALVVMAPSPAESSDTVLALVR